MFTLIYNIILLLVYIILLPILPLLIIKSKFRNSIPARFFLFKNSKFNNENQIWFHACSLGEVISLKPLIDKLKQTNKISITTTTQTGYNAAKNMNIETRFLPYELFLYFWIGKVKTLVVVEAELYLMLFLVAKLKGAKVVLINARISDNSYKSYLKFSFYYKHLFKYCDQIFAQSPKDKKRLQQLGANNIEVIGNIKTANKIEISKSYEKQDKTIITIASSHEGEEELILKHLKLENNIRLIVAPRHPERFQKVEKILKNYTRKNSLSFNTWNNKKDFQADVILLDTLGELINIYNISDTVILCGSFIQGIGGHNPLEPATFKTKIISGKYVFNQKSLYNLVENIQITDIKDINQSIQKSKPSKIIKTCDISPIIKSL